MKRKFEIPAIYRSTIITRVKEYQLVADPRRRNFNPTKLDFGPVEFIIPRHFGFCFGVQNAIEIAYKTIDKYSDKRIFFLSEMIHNPTVNKDLVSKGVKFIFEPSGKQIINWDDLTSDDIVVVPAFGTTVEIQSELNRRGIDPYSFDTTCPFVEKVWTRGVDLGKKGFSNVIHGKHTHEETRATFSHVAESGPAVVILNVKEATILADIITKKRDPSNFQIYFSEKSTPGFDPENDLKKFGVINQTTMLATETQQIMEILRSAVIERFGEAEVKNHFADTSDTLCYATNENQTSTIHALETKTDLAFVVGGYNSSNTSHLVELSEGKVKTFFNKDESEIKSVNEIQHFNWQEKKMEISSNWFPESGSKIRIMMNSGASCPDSTLDGVIFRLLDFFDKVREVEDVLNSMENNSI